MGRRKQAWTAPSPSSPGSYIGMHYTMPFSAHGTQASVEIQNAVIGVSVVDQEHRSVRNLHAVAEPACRNAASQFGPIGFLYDW